MFKRLFGNGEPAKPAWQQKIDDENEKARIGTRQEGATRAAGEKERIDKIFAEFQQKFRCHVCDKPANYPTEEYIDQGRGFGYSETNWDSPRDLYKCVRCKQWTCQKDIYKGTCRKCAQDL